MPKKYVERIKGVCADCAGSELSGLVSQHLDLKDGSVITIKGPVNRNQLSGLLESINKRGFVDVLVICLEDGQEISVLDESKREEFGWLTFRANDVAAIRECTCRS